jgi:hypothetical protein
MKTVQDLRLLYKQSTGLEALTNAYGYRPYLEWLEENAVKAIQDYEYIASKHISSTWDTPPSPKGDMID